MTENDNPLARRSDAMRKFVPDFIEDKNGNMIPTEIGQFVDWLNSLNFGRRYTVGRMTDGRRCVADVDRPSIG